MLSFIDASLSHPHSPPLSMKVQEDTLDIKAATEKASLAPDYVISVLTFVKPDTVAARLAD